MSAQRRDSEVITDAAKREAVHRSLRSFVRKTAPRKSQRDAAKARAATVKLRT